MSQTKASDVEAAGGKALMTEQGRTSIADSVVLKIAGVAAREVAGVHAMGTGGARAFGALKERLPGGGGGSPSQGVSVEVGERQAAIDIDVVVEYGVSIPDVSQAVRRNVIQRVERMTGLEVTEVNIAVGDVYLGGEDEEEEPEPARVQ
ncbi:MAG: Asp23/Gls24 family envelope stress response protein [Actinomycetota bacterium]|nr:Asp23/Gls24 family envelope stress response protein [Actinomycetota bacterium]MDQ3574985.1 Asp23/Gls24 family envelope stress response protein [Actinomycetota bacterium]